MGSRRWLVAGMLIVATASSPARGNDTVVTRRIATLAPEGSLWMNQLVMAAAKIEQFTAGRVKTKYYGGGVQGDERDVVRKMRLKQLDGAALTSVGLALIYPGIRVLELPFLWDSVEEVDYVRERTWAYFRQKFSERGFELLAPGDIGWIYLFSNIPVTNRADLRSVRIWAWQDDPLVRRLFHAMGIDGVPLSVPEVLPSLSNGRINAAYSSPLAAVAMQWHTRVRYMSSEPLGYSIGGMVIRSEVWNQGSSADREVQNKVARKLLKKSIQRVRRDNERAVEALRKNGLAVVPTSSEVTQLLDREARKLWKGLVGKLYSQEELDMVLKYRDEFRNSGEPNSGRGLNLD